MVDRAPDLRSALPGLATPTPAPPRKGEGKSRAEALKHVRRILAEAGFESAGLEARLLLLEALKIKASDLIAHPDTPLTEQEHETLEAFAKRRLAHEPVSRIVGMREFWGLPFALSPETLVPRPDTETVVETVLRLLPDRSAPYRIADFGTGSGCLLVALLHDMPNATGLGIDLSPGALAVARRNADANGVGARCHFVASRWADALAGRFDLIVSNPPYIASGVIPTLAPEVREHDPLLALDGGADGLDAYRVLLGEAGRLLEPGGLMALEIGYDQGEALGHLAASWRLEIAALAHDLGRNPRCIVLRRP